MNFPIDDFIYNTKKEESNIILVFKDVEFATVSEYAKLTLNREDGKWVVENYRVLKDEVILKGIEETEPVNSQCTALVIKHFTGFNLYFGWMNWDDKFNLSSPTAYAISNIPHKPTTVTPFDVTKKYSKYFTENVLLPATSFQTLIKYCNLPTPKQIKDTVVERWDYSEDDTNDFPLFPALNEVDYDRYSMGCKSYIGKLNYLNSAWHIGGKDSAGVEIKIPVLVEWLNKHKVSDLEEPYICINHSDKWFAIVDAEGVSLNHYLVEYEDDDFTTHRMISEHFREPVISLADTPFTGEWQEFELGAVNTVSSSTDYFITLHSENPSVVLQLPKNPDGSTPIIKTKHGQRIICKRNGNTLQMCMGTEPQFWDISEGRIYAAQYDKNNIVDYHYTDTVQYVPRMRLWTVKTIFYFINEIGE